MRVTVTYGRAVERRRHRILQWASGICLVAGVIILVSCAYLLWDAHIFETVEAERFDAVAEQSLVTAPSAATAIFAKPARPNIGVGSVLGRMEIPSVQISVMVLEGQTSRILRRAAGHVEGTATPGTPGNVAIAGHRDSFFRPLRKIQNRDVIKFTTMTGSYLYRVESIRVVGPNDVQVLDDSPEPTLTLVTCYPFYYVGPAPKRFVVRARQIFFDPGPALPN